MNPYQLQTYVIDPALSHAGLYSNAASLLMLGTAITESGLSWLRQHGGGPARGIYQVEPATHDDIWRNFLRYRGKLQDSVIALLTGEEKHQQLVSNLSYATVIARIVYWRVEEALPPADDVEAMADYWKRHYNTRLGAGEPAHFVEKAGPHLRDLMEA